MAEQATCRECGRTGDKALFDGEICPPCSVAKDIVERSEKNSN